MMNEKMRILLVVPCMLALMVGTAWATSPYDMPYGIQWNFMAGTVTRAGNLEVSPDGSVWIENGTGINTRAFAQISTDGLVYQGTTVTNHVGKLPGLSGTNQFYSPSISFAGNDPTAYFAYHATALWTDASPPDTKKTQWLQFSVSSLAGTTPVDYPAMPAPTAAELDPTNKFTFDLLGGYSSGQETVMASDTSYYMAQGTQGDLFTAGDFSGPAGTNYSPAIGHISADGLTLSGPAHQPAVDARAYLLDCDVNETTGKVYGAGYTSLSDGPCTYFDPDGPGPIPQINFDPLKPNKLVGFAQVWDTTTWAVDKTVIWESSNGGEYIRDIRATSDNGFVVVGYTSGDMSGTNPLAGEADGYIEKYNADGTLAWAYQTQFSGSDTFSNVKTDADGNLYVVGTQNNGTDNDATLTKFKLDGTLVWTKVVDNGGSEDAVLDVATISKDKVYLYSQNKQGIGTAWSNTVTYTPAAGAQTYLLQKMSPGDFNGDGVVDFTDVQFAGTQANALGSGNAVDTYDFDEDGTSDYKDIRYMITNIMDRKLGDIHPGPVFDIPPDVDNADLGKAAGSFNGSTGTGKTYFDGDMDFDGDVDNSDLGFVAGEFTGALAGVGGSGAGDVMIYDPATGNVKLDADEAGGDVIKSFQFETDGEFRAANYQDPTNGGYPGGLKEVTVKAIADTSNFLFTPGGGCTGVQNLGDIFPTGMDLDQLRAFLTTAVVTGELGSGQINLLEGGIYVVPEPATMALLGLGGLSMLARRRRRL